MLDLECWVILTLSMNYAPVFFSNYAAYSSGKVDAANIEPVGPIAIDPIIVSLWRKI